MCIEMFMNKTNIYSILVSVCAMAFIVAGGAGCDGDAATSDAGIQGADIIETQDDVAVTVWTCQIEDEADLTHAFALGCQDDFDALASLPLDASVPGARSLKTVIDRFDDRGETFPLYFINSKEFMIHWEFAFQVLNGDPYLPPVKQLSEFNQSEYYQPQRRFLLGAITHYEEPGVWVYELAPYDTSSADMIEAAFMLIKERAFFGEELLFHPTSQAVEIEAAKLPDTVPVITTDELFSGISYQPYNLATATGVLRFFDADGLANADLNYRDIAVLSHVPNDIGVVAGIITSELQTPLSHINVLSQNRGTPNMALLGGFDDPQLRALEGKWVLLTVGAFEWAIEEITVEEADAWWEENKPEPVGVPAMDLSVTDLRDVQQIVPLDGDFNADNPPSGEEMSALLATAIPAFGGKASHYGFLPYIGDVVPVPKAFAVPLFYYHQHMQDNGLGDDVDALLDDPELKGDNTARSYALKALQKKIKVAPVNQDFLDLLLFKIETEYPGVRMRFRSSTNAEDLDGFTGAGLYTSAAGIPGDPVDTIEDAVRTVWASIWNYKAFDEREYRSIDHRGVGMALLVHRSFPDEEANGVALTANIFDTTGLEPGFYVNVQDGGASVVLPEAGVTTDSFIHYYYQPGSPIIFLTHSNQIDAGETVLTHAQTNILGQGLDAIQRFFKPIYGPPPTDPTRFYAMDVEFKFEDDDGPEEKLVIKQARPHPGWGL